MEGTDGKYQHADLDPAGGTQIGGMRTKTPSMIGADYGAKGELSGIASQLAKYKPYIEAGPTDFRP